MLYWTEECVSCSPFILPCFLPPSLVFTPNSPVWPGSKARALSHCIPIFSRHSSAKSLRSFIFIAARAAIYWAFIKNHISGGRTVEARMELEAGGTVEEQKDRTACAGSCCLDAGEGGWTKAVSDTLSSRQATTDMTYRSFIPFAAMRKWKGTGDSLRSGHWLTEPKRNAVDWEMELH